MRLNYRYVYLTNAIIMTASDNFQSISFGIDVPGVCDSFIARGVTPTLLKDKMGRCVLASILIGNSAPIKFWFGL